MVVIWWIVAFLRSDVSSEDIQAWSMVFSHMDMDLISFVKPTLLSVGNKGG